MKKAKRASNNSIIYKFFSLHIYTSTTFKLKNFSYRIVANTPDGFRVTPAKLPSLRTVSLRNVLSDILEKQQIIYFDFFNTSYKNQIKLKKQKLHFH